VFYTPLHQAVWLRVQGRGADTQDLQNFLHKARLEVTALAVIRWSRIPRCQSRNMAGHPSSPGRSGCCHSSRIRHGAWSDGAGAQTPAVPHFRPRVSRASVTLIGFMGTVISNVVDVPTAPACKLLVLSALVGGGGGSIQVALALVCRGLTSVPAALLEASSWTA
jgi:hypothetical protein